MKWNVREWLRRYGPAEVLSVLATLGGAFLAFTLTRNSVSTALAGTWAGNVAYFGYLLGLDVSQTRRQLRAVGQPYTFRTLLRNLRALIVEFGLAEVFDSFLVRPALMYYLPRAVGSLAGGILLAKVLADVTFYIPAILSYELSKKRLRRF
ncbi:hypothetical protein [Hymenobacter chitinivorans]|uniref:Uncharacterized protein n=1 Tax=Hymenobacter chitinivorans DSM 11115 TaxID=1121954 RepID=A0A2M9AQV2_9BACT|nr:hypothetical protein [Hymenobacter chitinivorans]PJJ48077.1 hypothetical protein CLV45_4770 [Hymenobacter chitinivorans DSM 11115]